MIQEQIEFLKEKTSRLIITISEAERKDENSGKYSLSAYTGYLKEELAGYKSVLKLLENTKPSNRNIDTEIAFMCNEMSDLRRRIFNSNKLLDSNKSSQGGMQALSLNIDAMQKHYDHLVVILEHLKQTYIS